MVTTTWNESPPKWRRSNTKAHLIIKRLASNCGYWRAKAILNKYDFITEKPISLVIDLSGWWISYDALYNNVTLQWCHNGCDSVSNHQLHDCLLNRLFRRRSKKHQSSASLALVWGIHRGPVNSPHKWPVTRKMFRFDDVIMKQNTFFSTC